MTKTELQALLQHLQYRNQHMNKLIRALETIADWNSHTAQLQVDYGSQGVRDFYRQIALTALAEQPVQTDWEAVAADQAMTIALLKSEQPCTEHADQTKKYTIGGQTYNRVFKPAGLENLYNLQAVLDQMEKALATHPLTAEQVEQGRKQICNTANPFCPDSAMFSKIVRWTEAAHNIKENT